MTSSPADLRPPLRLRATALAMRGVAGSARRAGRGGSVLGGHVGLWLDPELLGHLAHHRRIITISATNGKTTTTRLLHAALSVDAPVLTNARGSNLRTGIAAALAADLKNPGAVLEVDEATLAKVAVELRPAVVVLGNLSRDQLDRYGEVRILAQRWRSMFVDLAANGHRPQVVANADDPLVAWSAAGLNDVTWVAAGSPWTADAGVCPECTSSIERGQGTWRCSGCDLARPTPDVAIDGNLVVFHDPRGEVTVPVSLALPGAFNVANAALALTAARIVGTDPTVAAQAMETTDQVEGRYRTVQLGDRRVRLLMAKNPAGWQSALEILQPPPTPVVLAINARVADGRDPSWLYDVEMERLAGRSVVAAGERAEDLSVRLHYAGVDHTCVPGPALEAVRSLAAGPADLVANYTAFADTLAAL